jgi:hypothetical protein
MPQLTLVIDEGCSLVFPPALSTGAGAGSGLGLGSSLPEMLAAAQSQGGRGTDSVMSGQEPERKRGGEQNTEGPCSRCL